MKLIGNVRLGRDAELRHTQGGTAVATLFGAYRYGRKGDDGKRPTQWVEATLWGAQAEAMADYLKKGEQFLLTLNEVHVQGYEKLDGTPGVKLMGTVRDIDFIGGTTRHEELPEQPLQRSAAAPASLRPAPARQAPLRGHTVGYGKAEEELPF